MPVLPRDNYDAVTITFNVDVDIETFIEHVNVNFELNGKVSTARLESAGGGRIDCFVDGEQTPSSYIRGAGNDRDYTYEDNTHGHGPLLNSIEWVD